MQDDESDNEDEDGDEEMDETALEEMEMSRMGEEEKDIAEEVQANVWQRSWIRRNTATTLSILVSSRLD